MFNKMSENPTSTHPTALLTNLMIVDNEGKVKCQETKQYAAGLL